MVTKKNRNNNYQRAIEIAEGVFWVGFYDKDAGLHCNPYVVIDEDEAVIIDGGSRPDFPVVMMKILQTGIKTSSISSLIYQHYDPDLCGSIQNFEDIIERKDLKIISDIENHMFIRHYSTSSQMISLNTIDHKFKFKSGKELLFINTPYSHSPGSFITYDKKNKILFSSDLFGSYGKKWELYYEFNEQCITCDTYDKCPNSKAYCPMPDIQNFHKKIMTSELALKYALNKITDLDIEIIAPQHGSLISGKNDIAAILSQVYKLKKVGINTIVENCNSECICDINSLIKKVK